MAGGVRSGQRNDSQYEGRTDTELVLAARSDDPEAFGELFQRWFDRSWNVARNIIRSDDLAAEIAQDAMVKAWQGLNTLQNPDAFGGWLLRITRNRALSRLEREQRSRATEDDIVSGIQDRQSQLGHDSLLGGQSSPEVGALVDIRDRQELVWAAAQALGDKDASLLDLHLRYGLTPAEIADEMGMEANAAHQQLFRLRGKLGDAIGSYLLWRNGRPLCEGLAAAVSGEKAFDRSVSKAVRKHQTQCEDCAERRAGLVDPAKLFASVPFIAVPAHLKASAAAALTDAGVPVGGSGGAGGGSGSGGSAGDGHSFGGSPSGQSSDFGVGSGQTVDYGAAEVGGGGQPGEFDVTPAEPGAVSEPASVLESTSSYAAPAHAVASPMSEAASVPAKSGGLAWTVTKQAWGRSLLALLGVIVAFLVFVGLSDAVALANLFPFGGGDDDLSIGSEVIAGPAVDEDSEASGSNSNSTSSEGGNNLLQPADDDAGDGNDDSGQVADPADGETTTSAPSTSVTSPSTEATVATSSTETTATTGSSSTETTPTTGTSETTSSSTSETRPTTETTVDTQPTNPTTPTTGSTTSETTATTAAPDPPVIVRFTSRAGTGLCLGRTLRPHEAIWATKNVTSVTLFLPDGSSLAGKPSSSATFCAEPKSRVRLVAVGPGGETKASTTL